MNGIQNPRGGAHNTNLDKSFPGCMARVVNLFDFSPGLTRNKLLTDKPHHQHDVVKEFDTTLESNKPISHNLSRNSSSKKPNTTPMKMLIAQEMSKETESKHKPPGVVAKLMGLDALPGQESRPTFDKIQPKGSIQSFPIQPEMSPAYFQHQSPTHDQSEYGARPFQDQGEYKDVYQAWKESPKSNYINHRSPQNAKHDEKPSETKMALVRQKFIEAKRLATDEKLRQSKEFHDALDVLSSNKDLFLKFLQEPNSLFSQNFYQLQSIPQLPHTKRITVLRPSNTMENSRFADSENADRNILHEQNPNGWEERKPRSSPFASHRNDNLTQPTRIVVLKPSPGKIDDIKAVASPKSPSSVYSKDFFEDLEDGEVHCSREVAKEITRKMRENLGRCQMEDTSLPSVLSNGYVGDESSFNRSDNEYMGEGNLTDSEVMTPTSRHSWDYVNRFPSHCSSSFSRASYSPESSVCREAKKRLSERWAMMASTGNTPEQPQLRRSSSTLGEMLALSETNKSTRSNEEAVAGLSFSSSRSCGGEQDTKDLSLPCLSNSKEKDEVGQQHSPRNLLRSRSVPVSSTAYGARLNIEVSDTEVGKFSIPSEAERPKVERSSFRGKVSSLFFSRNKKPSKHKSMVSSMDDSHHGDSEQPSPLKINEDISQHVPTEEGSTCVPDPSSISMDPKRRTSSHEAVSFASKSNAMAGIQGESHEQPSPLSVLEAPFEDDNSTPHSSGSVKLDLEGPHLQPFKSNLISKSPPIESLVRSLSWDDGCSDTTSTPGPLKYPRVSSEAEEDEVWLVFIQRLLSSLWSEEDEEQHSDALFARWHSPESPLDPLLIDEYISLKDDKVKGSEAKRRQRRSNKKLIFDCVNAAVVDTTVVYGFNVSHCGRVSCVDARVTAEQVWNGVKEWFCGDAKWFSWNEYEGDNSQVVETVVKKEVVGKGWVELMRVELDSIRKEIEGKVLEELVEEVLFELTARLC